MTPRVREILSWYGSDNPGTLTSLARILNHGRLGGTGKLVILPADQGIEHGPARSFAKQADCYDPSYHFNLAIESGCNALAAPLGAIEACVRDYAGEIPLILKINHSDSLHSDKSAGSAMTSGIEDALRLGCSAIGFTIHPGTSDRRGTYEKLAFATAEAKKAGLVVVVWSCPSGEQISKAGETAIDIVAYGAQIACQLGAHIVKVKPPSSHIEQELARKAYAASGIPIESLIERVRHVIDASFSGKRIVLFSAGETKSGNELLDEAKAMATGGSFGSMIGRNAFQQPKREAIDLLKRVQDVFAGVTLKN